jgi:hypothetical protein
MQENAIAYIEKISFDALDVFSERGVSPRVWPP